MNILINAVIELDPAQRDAALEAGRPHVIGALSQEGCLNYSWCPDPDPEFPGRIHVFERWASKEALAHHFKNKHYLNMRDTIGAHGIISAESFKYQVSAIGQVYDSTGNPSAEFE